jgi:hypothetical protein
MLSEPLPGRGDGSQRGLGSAGVRGCDGSTGRARSRRRGCAGRVRDHGPLSLVPHANARALLLNATAAPRVVRVSAAPDEAAVSNDPKAGPSFTLASDPKLNAADEVTVPAAGFVTLVVTGGAAGSGYLVVTDVASGRAIRRDVVVAAAAIGKPAVDEWDHTVTVEPWSTSLDAGRLPLAAGQTCPSVAAPVTTTVTSEDDVATLTATCHATGTGGGLDLYTGDTGSRTSADSSWTRTTETE